MSGDGCGAYVSVITRFKASTVQLNLPTGTELGNKKTYKKLFLIRGPIPTTTPVGNRVNSTTTPVGNKASTLNHYIFVNFGCMPNFSLIGYVEVGF